MPIGPSQPLLRATRARAGDLAFYPGPERQQRLCEAFGSRWAHVGIVIEQQSNMKVVELGLNGVQVRSLCAIRRHYGTVGIGRLPISAEVAAELALCSSGYINQGLRYGHGLAKLQYYWANLRSIESEQTAAATMIALPAAVAASRMLARNSAATCSSFVYEILVQLNLDVCLDLRLDRRLPDGPAERWRWHHRCAGLLCSPGDLWCAHRLAKFVYDKGADS